MNYTPETERQVQTRAEMTALLFEISGSNTSKVERPHFPEGAETYGLLVVLFSVSFVIAFGGDVQYQLIALLGLYGSLLGAFVIFASVFSLATKLNKGSLFLCMCIAKLWRKITRRS